MKNLILLFCLAGTAIAKPAAEAEGNADALPTGQYADILANAAYAYAEAGPIIEEVAPVVVNTQFHAQSELGEYQYGYSNPTSSKIETKTADGVVEGSYSYVSPDGRIITNNYVSDALGFRSSLAPSNGEEAVYIPADAPLIAAAAHAPIGGPIAGGPLGVESAYLAADIGPAVAEAYDVYAAEEPVYGEYIEEPLVYGPEPQPLAVHQAVPTATLYTEEQPAVLHVQPHPAEVVYHAEPEPAVVHHEVHHPVVHAAPAPVVHHQVHHPAPAPAVRVQEVAHHVEHVPVAHHVEHHVPAPAVRVQEVAHHVEHHSPVVHHVEHHPVPAPRVQQVAHVEHHHPVVHHAHPAPAPVKTYHHKQINHYNHHQSPKSYVHSLPSRSRYFKSYKRGGYGGYGGSSYHRSSPRSYYSGHRAGGYSGYGGHRYHGSKYNRRY